jgi:hypothetical protein
VRNAYSRRLGSSPYLCRWRLDERYWNACPHDRKPPRDLLCGTVLYLLTNGFVWARFVALLVEVVGAETGDASTFYSALNAAGTIPFVFMIWLDGFGYSRFGTRGLLWTDAAPNLLVFAIVATVLVIRGMNLQSRPAQQLHNL